MKKVVLCFGIFSIPLLFPLPIVATALIVELLSEGTVRGLSYVLVHAMAFVAFLLIITVGAFIEARYEHSFSSRFARLLFSWVVLSFLIFLPMWIALQDVWETMLVAFSSSIFMGIVAKVTEPIWDDLLNSSDDHK